MNKITLALIAGCLSAAVAGAHAASGSPADSDKAGRMGPGTAAGQQGATDPSPPTKAGGTTGSRAAGTGAAGTGTGATGTGGAAATDMGTGSGTTGTTRRAPRASKG